ncbi:MotA/TolQ/ExbB proton channel family protein [Gammaproteobacteria bacterium]|jgi:biopolymer transport protein ExbB|nr:MotA/TolQ/ExbB proton channel family protein [Pseudomonadota bacterium]MDB0064547.1 MotA/TolQ/ExbB proton channel family protein [Gammaproteobacteria bacterium]
MEKAFNLLGISSEIQSLFDAGGPVLIILLFMSVLGIATVLLKVWQFSRIGVIRNQALESALHDWRQGDEAQAQETLAGIDKPIAKIVLHAIELHCQSTFNVELAREEIIRLASIELLHSRQYFRILEVIAALSPLLGLFGTVLGMIDAFQQLEAAGSSVDPAILSGGIWVALLTTAAGLAVAIPTIILLNYLEGVAEKYKSEMEDSITRVFTAKTYLA